MKITKTSDISDVLKSNFGTYAAYVIAQRAVPDIRDGLKPVHRRLLYTAYELGARPGRKYMKSAEVSNTAMGRYHPHGDAYGTMVRMAQDFVMLHPLFDGQGNFGSVEGDPPAANRYCVRTGTPIVMSDGTSRSVENIKVGDKVLTHRGHAQPVEGVFPMKHGKLIRYELENGLVFYASLNHPLLVLKEGDWSLTWARSHTITVNDRLCCIVNEGDRSKKNMLADNVDPGYMGRGIISSVATLAPCMLPANDTSKIVKSVVITSLNVVDNEDNDHRTWDLQVANDHTYLIGTSFEKHVVSHNTECRLTKFAEDLFFNDLNEDVVDWKANYADNRREPIVLPSELPHLLLNGTSGIAVGLSTSIISCNAREIIECLVDEIDNGSISSSRELNPKFRGPDFPTRGVLEYNHEALVGTWSEGRGSFSVRGTASVETNEKTHKKRLVITSIPWMVNRAKLAEKIAHLIVTKNDDGSRLIEGVTDMRDESSSEGTRIVFELSSRTSPDVLLNILYKKTRLQDKSAYHMVVIDNGKPRQVGVRDVLLTWLSFRRDCVRKIHQRELNEIINQLELIEAYLLVHKNIDKVIHIIKNSDDVKNELKKNLSLNDRQVDAVVNMKLGKLRRIDNNELLTNKNEKLTRKKQIDKILADPKLIDNEIKNRLLWWYEKMPERKTKVVDKLGKIEVINTIVREDLIFSVDGNNKVKMIRLSDYKLSNRNATGVMISGEDVNDIPRFLVKVSSHDHLMVFTSDGMFHEIDSYKLPIVDRKKNKTVPLVDIFPNIKDDVDVVKVLSLNKNTVDDNLSVVMLTASGSIKRLRAASMFKHRGNSITCFLFKNDNDKMISVTLAKPDDDIVVFTQNGIIKRISCSAIRSTNNNKCAGVNSGSARSGDKLLSVDRVGNHGTSFAFVTQKGYGGRVDSSAIPTRKGRITSGIKLCSCSELTGNVVFAACVDDGDEFIITASDMKVVRFKADQLKMKNRCQRGVMIKKMNDNETITAAAVIRHLKD